MTCYWSGEEPSWNNGSKFYELNPPLNSMPKEVDTVILWYGHLDITYTKKDGVKVQSVSVNTDRLTLYNSKKTIQGWMKDLRANNPNVKIIMSVISGSYPDIEDQDAFATTLSNTLTDWGVDGVDIDFEPPTYVKDGTSDRVSELMKKIRTKLTSTIGKSVLMTAPIYHRWLEIYVPGDYNYLGAYAANFDYLTTMDYTGYVGYDTTIDYYKQYAAKIGSDASPAYDKLAIGVSCMGPSTGPNFTPLGDGADPVEKGVIQLTKWEPDSGHKQGIMVFTLSYDVTLRYYGTDWENKSGTGYPDLTWTNTVIKDIPDT